jgi:hypothetical protein
MNIEPTAEARTTIEQWLQTNLLEELNSWDMLPQVVGDFPENTGRGYLTAIKRIESMDLGSMQLNSLSQSTVNATLSVTLSVSLYVSKEDYDASQEVRDFVGPEDDDFSGIYLDTDTKLRVSFDFELFKEPPMVLSTKLRSVGGDSTTYNFD